MAELTTEQFLPFTLELKDGRGRPKDYEGDAVVASSDETVATAEMTSRTEGRVNSGIPGEATITVTVDADLGEGMQQITGTLACVVTLDPRTGARIMELKAGEATDRAA